ncbi:MAG: hypothetical protein KC731_33330 [Myxococcales bacterium]|nr:hypothetical protein [Myxococcales bacterium]
MPRLTSLTLLPLLLLAACTVEPDDPGDGANQATNDPLAGWCSSNRFVTDLGGLPGVASLTHELGLEFVFVEGAIESETAHYTFTGCQLPRDPYSGAITGNLCWVDVNTTGAYERFRAEMEFHDQGFWFTANAYEGAYSTTYDFRCE